MKRQPFLGIVVFTLLSSVAWAEDPVYFADAKLKALVEAKLGVTDPTPTDMLGLTWLSVNREGVTSLTGIQYAINLTYIYLEGNEISDISPLSGLTELTSLPLGHNDISNVSPLSGLTNLTSLGLAHNGYISNISALSGLTNLTSLYLDDNQVSDISPLAGLTNLTELGISSNPISSISALSGLTNLTYLSMGSSNVSDLSPLSGLSKLEVLSADYAEISNVSPLGGMTSLERVYLYGNQISSLSGLSGLTQLTRLDVGSNEITNISPLAGFTNLSGLDLIYNPLNNDAYCTYLPSILAGNPGVSLSYSANDNPPAHVSASDGTYTDKVLVTWDGVCSVTGDTHYSVYRSESEGGSKVSMSSYQLGTALEDTTATSGVTYYYWVVAHTIGYSGSPHQTDYSFSDTGWCGAGPATHSLSTSSTAGGSVTAPGEGSFSYAPGTSVSVAATADTDYEFSGWGGTAVTAGKVADTGAASTTVTMDDDYTLVANFTPTTPTARTLSISSGTGGSVTSPGEGWFSYAPGTSVSVVAIADTDYEFVGWSGTAVAAGKVANTSAASTTVTMDGNYTLMANFASTTSTTYTLNVSSGPGGTVVAPGQGAFSYVSGTVVSIVAAADTDCEFVGWSGTAVTAGKLADAGAASTTVTMDGDYTLIAGFVEVAPSTNTLSLSSDAGGSVTAPGEGTFTYESGTTVSVQAVAQSGFRFNGWTGTAVDAGQVADPTAASTTVTVDGDYTLVAGFVGETILLELSSTEGGAVVMPGEGTYSYDYLETVAVQAEPEPGYHFVEWSGSVYSTSNPTSIEMDADHQVTAVFAANSPILTISSSLGGSVILPGEGAFVCASDPNVRAVALPEAGYAFAGWSGTIVDTGVPADPTVARVDLVVNGEATLHANFEPVARCLYVDDDAAGDPAPGNPAVSDPAEDGTWDHPFDAIQEAIDAAADCDGVLVLPGTYRENITFAGKGIMVTALDLGQLGTVSETVIVGTGTDSVVIFEAGESPDSLLVGFSILGGSGELGGGIRCDGADPIIAHCLITGHRADLGAGVYCRQSQATLANCTIADNLSWVEGGGLHCDGDVTVINSIFYGNQPDQIVADPDRVPFVTYSAVRGGWPGAGNIDGYPRFVQRGHWASLGDPESLVAPNAPDAVWAAGDYHLQATEGRWNGWMWLSDGSTSPCVDAGLPKADVKWEPLPNGGRINMGAFGGTAEASRSLTASGQ